MSRLIRGLRRLSANHLAVRAVEQAWLDWCHEVELAPGALSAFTADARAAIGMVRLIVTAVLSDVAIAARAGWLARWGAWTLVAAGIFASASVVAGAVFSPFLVVETLVDATPFALFLTVALSSDRDTPALGLLCAVGIAACVGESSRPFLGHAAHAWSLIAMWMLWPVCLVLAADRIRRDSRRGSFVAILLGSWLVVRLFLAVALGWSGGYYDRWLVWLVPVTPAIVWFWLVRRQEPATDSQESVA
jgi:hypothetical protein